jgi:hypothetical protein
MVMTFNPQFIGKLERCRRVRTDDALGEIWKTFLKLTDFRYLEPRWQGHSNEDLTRVVTYLRQAYEYHLASKGTSLLTRPVLAYYSFLNLAKAVLSLVTDNTPSDYHGLCRHHMDNSLLQVSAQTNNGVFRDLANTLGSPIGSGLRLNIENLVLNTVELRDSYCDYFQKSPLIIEPMVDIYLNGEIYVTFRPSAFLGLDRIRFLDVLSESTDLFNDFDEQKDESRQEMLKLKIKVPIPREEFNARGSDLLARHFMFSVFDSRSYYLNLNKRQNQLHPGAAYFGIMFLLSSIARYGPNYIDQFVNLKEKSVSWFFREICESAERAFPNLLLNALEKSSLKFAASFSF